MLVLALCGSATAYVAPAAAPASATAMAATKDQMAGLAEANPDYLGASLGLWDPLGCLNLDFWTLGNEATLAMHPNPHVAQNDTMQHIYWHSYAEMLQCLGLPVSAVGRAPSSPGSTRLAAAYK